VNLSDWLQELRRRRVFRALAGYGLVSFALLQVAEPVMHGLGLPDWVLKVVVIGLGLGFPVTIILAWAYDLKATGIERTPSSGAGRSWRTVALVSVGLLLAAPGVTYYLLYRGHATGGTDAATANATPSSTTPSIAVLPFADMSPGHDQEYFADGVAEEILNALAHVEGLRVTGRTSSFWFKGKRVELAEIGRKLNVSHVLEGSVRRSGSRLRVTAQVVKVADGYHLWSETFDRSEADVFAVQDEVAHSVAQALKLRLVLESGSEAGGTRTTNPEVYRLYLLGQQQLRTFHSESNKQAIASFKRVIEIEPTYAPAWAGLAHASFISATTFEANSTVMLPAALAAAEKAIALAPGSALGYAARSELRRASLDYAGAHADLERALALNPNDASTLVVKTRLLANEGQLTSALQASRRSVDLDPLNAEAWVRLGAVLMGLGDLPGARTALQKADDVSGTSSPGAYFRILCELAASDPDAALQVARRSELEWERLTGIAMATHTLGRPAESQAALDELIAVHQRDAAYQVAEVFAWRGERDRSFEWLERAYAQRDTGIGLLSYDPVFRQLRGDPRYKAMLRKLNLPPG